MLLVNYKGTAVHPFPCPLFVSKRTKLDKDGQTTHPYHAIMCGGEYDFMIATYHDLAPAKMEIKRLTDQYAEDQNSVFTFMRDPYEEV